MKILLILIGIVLGTTTLCDAAGQQDNCIFRLKNGTCECCASRWRRRDNLSNCTIACAHCRNSHIKGRCIEQCDPGYYGPVCDRDCPEHCAKDDNNKSLCDKVKGHCSPKGCDHGFHGDYCDRKCSPRCIDGCWRNGSCITCDKKLYGDKCEHTCSVGCREGKCNRDGSCDCKPGYDSDKCEDVKNTNVSTMIEIVVPYLVVILVFVGLSCFKLYGKWVKTGMCRGSVASDTSPCFLTNQQTFLAIAQIRWLKRKSRRTRKVDGENEALRNQQEKLSIEVAPHDEDEVFNNRAEDKKIRQGPTAETEV